jgi:protein-S-isoprenylcysteine O-methyltransferase Ste14
MDVEAAKTLAIGVVVVFVALSVVSAIVIKNVVTKLIGVLLMVGLALGVWTQRTNLQDCAKRAQERYDAGVAGELTCTFFGSDITIDEDDDPSS